MEELKKFTEHEKYANLLNDQFMKATGLNIRPVNSHWENSGGTSSGKTHREKILFISLFKDLFDAVYIISPSASLDQWKEIGIPEKNIYEETLTEQRLDSIIKECQDNFDEPPDGRPKYHWCSMIILDDNGDLTRQRFFSNKLIRARHAGASIHTLVQSNTFNNPTARTNFSYFMLKPLEFTEPTKRRDFAKMRGIPNNRVPGLAMSIPTLEEAVVEWSKRYEVDPKGSAYDYLLVDAKSPIPTIYICRENDIKLVTHRHTKAKINGANVLIPGTYDPATNKVTYNL